MRDRAQGPDSRAIYDCVGVPFPSNEPSEHETVEDIAEYGRWDESSFERRKYDQVQRVDGKLCFTPRDDAPTSKHEPRVTHHPVKMRKKVTLEDFSAEVRTYSAVQSWDRANEGSISVIDEMLDQIAAVMAERGLERTATVEVAWAHTLLLMRKEAV